MIAAVFDVRGPEAARARLETLGNSAEFAIGEAATNAYGAVMIWRGVLPVAIDRAACTASLGRATSPLASPTLSAAQNISGDVAMMTIVATGLILIRGRFGGRPIYFKREDDGRCIVACSRLEPLLGSQSPALDVSAIAALLADPCALPSRTPYRDVARVDGGEAALVTASSVVTRALVAFPGSPIFAGSPDDAAEELRARIDDAVGRAISGKKKIAVLVSGGVDSSTLLASAIAVSRGASRAEVEAISLHFSGIGDDRPHLHALANELGIAPVHVSPDDCTDSLGDKFVIDAAPFVWPALGWLSKVGRLAVARGADLLLTGTGGDEMFGLGLDTFVENALAGNPISALRRTLAFRAQTLPSASNRIVELLLRPMAHRALAPFPLVHRALRASLGNKQHVPKWFGDALIRELQNRARLAEPGANATALEPTEASTLDALARAAHLSDVAEMRAQLEIDSGCMRADPFLDDNLAGFLATLPRAYLTHGGRHRGLLVHAMRGRIPDSVRLRNDKGAFGGALDRAFTAAGGARSIEHLLSMRALEALGLVRGAEFRLAFSRFLNDHAARVHGAAWLELWPPLVVEAFLRSFERA